VAHQRGTHPPRAVGRHLDEAVDHVRA
jgi:hypothetical protein